MRSHTIPRASRVLIAVVASISLVLALAGCSGMTIGSTTTATPPPAATLTCAYALVPSPAGVPPTKSAPVSGELDLLCLVTGAPSGDTSFTLTLAITLPSTFHVTLTASPCTGTLQQGTGACAHTYTLSGGPLPTAVPTTVPLPAVVYGILLPSQQRLGPVTPILAASQ
jgi:hypothetical protein